MKLRKVVLVFLVLAGSLFILPAKAEELPTIDIVQLADGKLKISSADEAVIDGFVSLFLTNETEETVLSLKEASFKNNTLVFTDPGLKGDFSYALTYREAGNEITLTGKVVLAFAEEEIMKGDLSVVSLDRAPLDEPYLFHTQGVGNKALVWFGSYDQDVKYEVLYSTTKNGKYKEVNLYNYFTGSEYNSDSGETEYWSDWYGYFDDAKADQKYYLKARVYFDDGIEITYSDWATASFTLETGPVRNVEVWLTASNKLSFSWSKAKKATKYYCAGYGFEVGTITLFEDFVKGGGDPLDFVWDEHIVDFKRTSTKKTNSKMTINNVDMGLPIYVWVDAYKGKKRGQNFAVLIDDEFCRPVEDITFSADLTGKNVVFTFKAAVDVTTYELRRRDFGDDYMNSIKYLATQSLLKSVNNKTGNDMNVSGLDKITLPDNDVDRCTYDFNLFVATKAKGPYKRVETMADFSDPNNLTLTYKAKRGKKLFYKIVPTVEGMYWGSYFYPELYDKANTSYYANFVEKAEVNSFKLPK